MKLGRSIVLRIAAAAVALGAVGAAQARDNVYFSIGVQAAPGVMVSAGNMPPPVYYAPAPVYVAPAPVFVRPAPVYYAPPTRVYYGPVVYGKHWNKHRHWR